MPGPERASDRFGYATLAGLLAFAAAIAVAVNGPLLSDSYGTYRDGSGAIPILILATLLLSASLYRLVRRLPDGALVGQSAGWLAIVIAPFWPAVLWVMPLAAVLLAAMIVLAVALHRARMWPRWLVVILVGTLAIPLAIIAALMVLPWYTLRQGAVDGLLLIVPIGATWVIVGYGLLRGFPIAAPVPDADAPRTA